MTNRLPQRMTPSTDIDKHRGNASLHFLLTDVISDQCSGMPKAPENDPFADVPATVQDRSQALANDIIHTPLPPAHEDIIAQLAYEFAMMVQYPGFLDSLSSQSGASVTFPEYLPPMSVAEQAQYAALFPSHYSTEDILNGPLTIARILDDFGEDIPDVLDQPEYEDVLMLFAGDLKPTHEPGLPEVTRCDHHATSLDSHVIAPQSSGNKASDV